MAIVAIVAPCLIGAATGNSKDNKSSIARNLLIFNSLYKELAMSYVDTINPDKNITTAINYMLQELDPYTEYIKAEDSEDFMKISTGEYGGIGSYIMETKNDGVLISEPFEGSPAALAGLRPGDRILKINDDTTTNWRSSQVSEKLKGMANTTVRVVVDRPYVSDSILTRKKIQVPSVSYYKALDGGIGYIQLTTFNDNSPEEVKTALLELKKNPKVHTAPRDIRRGRRPSAGSPPTARTSASST